MVQLEGTGLSQELVGVLLDLQGFLIFLVEARLPLIVHASRSMQPQWPIAFEFDLGAHGRLEVRTVVQGTCPFHLRAYADKTILPTNYSE